MELVFDYIEPTQYVKGEISRYFVAYGLRPCYSCNYIKKLSDFPSGVPNIRCNSCCSINIEEVKQSEATMKILCRNRTNTLIRKKILVKPCSCQLCGDNTKIETHHVDYNDDMNVEWLCVPCHKNRHREIRMNALLIRS